MTTQKKKIKAYETRSKKYIPFRELQKLSKKLKKQGKKVVFTTGTYDLLNPGHCRYLMEAKSKGDVLVVGVSTDVSTSAMKGEIYPLINEDIRSELLSYVEAVDYVTLAPEDAPHAVLSLLQPDIYFTSEGAWNDGLRDAQEEYLVKSYGGKIEKRSRHMPYMGTEKLVEHLANIRVLQILENYLKTQVPDFKLDPDVHLPPADYGDQTPIFKDAFDPNKKTIDSSDLEDLRKEMKKKKKTTVLVSGSYDLLHTGHARFIEQAAILGDVLVVGIPSDQSLRAIKGVGRPVITEKSRAYVLASLDIVDKIVVYEYNVRDTLENLQPDIFFTVDEGWNKGIEDSPEYKIIKSYGGKIEKVERQSPFLSSSAIINKVASEKVKEIFEECMDEERYKKIVGEESRFNGNNKS